MNMTEDRKVTDTERLEWMAKRGWGVAYSIDKETCWLKNHEYGRDGEVEETVSKQTFRDAIDAEMNRELEEIAFAEKHAAKKL